MRFLFALLLCTLSLLPMPLRADFRGPYPIRAVATTGMVADLVRNVGGEKVAVTVLIGAGVDPHLYTPTRDDLAKLLEADAIFYNGLLLEGRMTDALAKVGKSKPAVAVAEALPRDILIDDRHSGHHDPHLWMDVKAWAEAARAVERALSAFDPKNASLYKENAAAYVQKLAALDAWAREAIASIPPERRLLVTAHDAFAYLSRAYGIEVRGIQGISTESEAGLRAINDLVDTIVQRKLAAVFVESSVSDKNVRALVEGAKSRGHAVTIGGSLFSDAMGREGTYEGTYIGMIDHNITTIVRALGGTAPVKGMAGKLAANGAS